MKVNVSSIDGLIRIILGLAVVVIGFIFESWWGLVGVVLLATGIFKWCPFYAVIGLSTVTKSE